MPPPPPLTSPSLQSPPEPAWKSAMVNCSVINLYQPSSWPTWFGKVIMIPKSQEAVYLASLTTPPPWLMKLFKARAFLPAHVSCIFKASNPDFSTSFCGEGIEREKVYDVVRDFLGVGLMVSPLTRRSRPFPPPSSMIFSPSTPPISFTFVTWQG